MRIDAITLVELYAKLWRTSPDKAWILSIMSERLGKSERVIEERLINLVTQGVKLPGFAEVKCNH